jgi:hypothetical protein
VSSRAIERYIDRLIPESKAAYRFWIGIDVERDVSHPTNPIGSTPLKALKSLNQGVGICPSNKQLFFG